jgi:hypothetical protein
MFLVTFPLAKVIRTGRLRARLVIAATAFILVLLLFGKQLVESGLSGSALSARVENVGRNATSGIRLIAIEFAFPVATLANATREVPGEVEFRWFYDLPLAVAYLVPQRLLGVEHPPTVSMVNTARFGATGAVPVDLLSFGYFSAGVPGVVLLMLVVGTVLVFFERILPPSPDPTDCILRAAWILFAAVRVMYGDPQLVWSGGLHLILMALVFVAISLVLHGRTLRGSRAVVVGTPGSGL